MRANKKKKVVRTSIDNWWPCFFLLIIFSRGSSKEEESPRTSRPPPRFKPPGHCPTLPHDGYVTDHMANYLYWSNNERWKSCAIIADTVVHRSLCVISNCLNEMLIKRIPSDNGSDKSLWTTIYKVGFNEVLLDRIFVLNTTSNRRCLLGSLYIELMYKRTPVYS